MEQKKMLHCMILAPNQELAEEYGKFLFESEIKEGFFTTVYDDKEIKAYCHWPEAPKGLPEFAAVDTLIIRIKDIKDWTKLLDSLNQIEFITFKVVVYDEEIVDKEAIDKIKPNISCKATDKNREQILSGIIKAEKEVSDLLVKVFKNFDKSGDGYIDISELESMCKELGIDTTKTDFQDTLKSLDVNNDKLISFQEFYDWFKQGRQSSKLMETLVTLRLGTSNILDNISNQTFLNSLKDKLQLAELEKKELINTFISINFDKVTMHPEGVISFNAYFGGEKKETLSKSYCNFYGEGLKASHYFLILEFELKDASKTDSMVGRLNVILNNFKDELRYISKNFSEFINNEISIMAIKKDEKTICLSCKLKRKRKEMLTNFENLCKSFLDETISQSINVSFTMSGEIDKVKENPERVFIDTFKPAISLECKAEILKRNNKVLLSLSENIPKIIKFWLMSYSGSRIEFNFDFDYLKTLTNSFLNFPCIQIVEYLKFTLMNKIKEILAPFGGSDRYKVFHEAIQEKVSMVLNTPFIFMNSKIEFNDLVKLFE